MAARDLTAARLRELLKYDPETGLFTWKVARRRPAGANVGCARPDGYIKVKLDQVAYLGHRLAWLYVHDCWPTHFLDHINGNPSDNRIENLRDVPQSMNQQNLRKAKSHNKLGVLGVHLHWGRYQAAIVVDGKAHRLGRFHTVEEAASAYLRAKRQLHAGCTI